MRSEHELPKNGHRRGDAGAVDVSSRSAVAAGANVSARSCSLLPWNDAFGMIGALQLVLKV